MIKDALNSMSTINGQFVLLIILMLCFFTVSITMDIMLGNLQNASDMAAGAFRDFFLIAIGLFRGMKVEDSPRKEEKDTTYKWVFPKEEVK